MSKKSKPKKKSTPPFTYGNCYKCGTSLEGMDTAGIVDSEPVYIHCKACKAVNNIRQRLHAWKEKYGVK